MDSTAIAETLGSVLSQNNIALIGQIISIVAFVLGCAWAIYKSKHPEVQDTVGEAKNKIDMIIQYAEALVSWARQFFNGDGPAKMDKVVEMLEEIAKRYNIDITPTELRAYAQRAYDSMKAGEAAAGMKDGQILEGKAASDIATGIVAGFEAAAQKAAADGSTELTGEEGNGVTEGEA